MAENKQREDMYFRHIWAQFESLLPKLGALHKAEWSVNKLSDKTRQDVEEQLRKPIKFLVESVGLLPTPMLSDICTYWLVWVLHRFSQKESINKDDEKQANAVVIKLAKQLDVGFSSDYSTSSSFCFVSFCLVWEHYEYFLPKFAALHRGKWNADTLSRQVHEQIQGELRKPFNFIGDSIRLLPLKMLYDIRNYWMLWTLHRHLPKRDDREQEIWGCTSVDMEPKEYPRKRQELVADLAKRLDLQFHCSYPTFFPN